MTVFITKISDIFIYVLNASLNGILAILAVMALRRLLYKAPKSMRPGLWVIAALRLVFPATFGFLTALLNAFSVSYAIVAPSGGSDNIVSLLPVGTIQLSPSAVGTGANFSVLNCATAIWFVGLLLFLAYSAVKYGFLKINLKGATPYSGDFQLIKNIPVYTSDKISSPFVAGFLKPVIYLPQDISDENIEYVLCHEAMHIKRKDYIFKFLAFLILRRHWFNPFVWLAFSLFGSDIEMACDEKSVAYLGEKSKKNYSLALLSMAAENGTKLRRPLYFGEGSVKARVKNILAYKKARPAVWVLAAIGAVCLFFWLYVHPVSVLKNDSIDYHREGTLIEFPAYQEGKNDYNSRIYDITPFSLDITFPWERYVEEPEEKNVGAPWTPVLIYNSAGEQIGTIGYGIFEDVPELGQDEIYKAAFRELRLSSRVLWLQDYTPVRTDEFCQTATSKTLVSDAYTNPDDYRGNTPEADFTEYPTATVFDRNMGVWAVAVFAPGSITDEDLAAMARSMTINSAVE